MIAQLIVMLLVARNTAPTVYMYAFVSTPSPPHAENYHNQGIPHQASISVQLRVRPFLNPLSGWAGVIGS
jgi:hypothetical protein